MLDQPSSKQKVGVPFSSLYDLLQGHAQRFAEAAAILAPDCVPLSYRRLYRHIDDIGSTLRAMWDDIQNRGAVQGGSTITQQYVKNAFTTGERTIGRKIREAILAGQLERAFRPGHAPDGGAQREPPVL